MGAQGKGTSQVAGDLHGHSRCATCPTTVRCWTTSEEEHAAGRKLYLATGADGVLARSIAAHLGIFDDVMASDGTVNLTGTQQAEASGAAVCGDGFDYIGNALPDLPLLQGARQAMLANPTQVEQCSEEPEDPVSRKFLDRSQPPAALAKALRCINGPRTCSSSCPCCWPIPSLRPCADRGRGLLLLQSYSLRLPTFSTTCLTWSMTAYT
jgi:hypothetical protein